MGVIPLQTRHYKVECLRENFHLIDNDTRMRSFAPFSQPHPLFPPPPPPPQNLLISPSIMKITPVIAVLAVAASVSARPAFESSVERLARGLDDSCNTGSIQCCSSICFYLPSYLSYRNCRQLRNPFQRRSRNGPRWSPGNCPWSQLCSWPYLFPPLCRWRRWKFLVNVISIPD